jgi:hypothetical protein
VIASERQQISYELEHHAVHAVQLTSGLTTMREPVASGDRDLVKCLGKALRELNQPFAEDPIPERLTSLLHLLEQKERDQTATADDATRE